MPDGPLAIDNDEVVYRRVRAAENHINREQDSVSPAAFMPRPLDVPGISLVRGKYRSPKGAAALGRRDRGPYYVVGIRAGDLRDIGIAVDPEGPPYHVRLPDLAFEPPPSQRLLELTQRIVQKAPLCIHGPFDGKAKVPRRRRPKRR